MATPRVFQFTAIDSKGAKYIIEARQMLDVKPPGYASSAQVSIVAEDYRTPSGAPAKKISAGEFEMMIMGKTIRVRSDDPRVL